MDNTNGRAVHTVRCVQGVYVLGIGGLTPTITNKGSKGLKLQDLKMTKVQDGVYCTASGTEFLIGTANILSVEFESL